MTDRPNILVIMTDQQRATASHLYGNTFCQTPSMERLSASGVLFENAITPHPLCVPARISFWTSQFPHSHGGRRNQTLMPASAEHAWQLWKAAGYATGLIGKNHCFQREEDLALFDVWNAFTHGGRGEETWGMDWFRPQEGRRKVAAEHRQLAHQNPRFSYGTSELPLEDHSTGLIAGQATRFLEKHRDQPFALWVSFPDPHEPWLCPAEYAALFPPANIDLPPWRDDEFDDERAPERNRVLYQMLGVRRDPPEDLYGVMASYFGMVRFIDDALGQILDKLDALGLREQTIVVFCSDHGDFMGEHAMQCKGGVFYDSLTRVPLIVSWPGQVTAGARDQSMANLIDVVPTLLHLQGLAQPHSMHGIPLPTVTAAAPRDATFSEYGSGGPLFTMSDLQKLPKPWGRKTLIDTLAVARGRRSVQDGPHPPVEVRPRPHGRPPTNSMTFVADPGELVNVIDEDQHRDALAAMRLRLADWSINTEDARTSAST